MQNKLKKEEGITLVALIVTIIVLIILAAVTIYAVVEANLVDVATKGTENYSTEQVKEVGEMDAVVGKLEETVSNIASIAGGTTTGGNGTGSGGDDNPSGGGDTPSVELPAVGTEVPTEGWSIEIAKGLVARDGLVAHLGEKVDYNPPAGGTWRIFYYDNEDKGNGKGYFGDPVGTVYLRRDYENNLTADLTEKEAYSPSDNGTRFYQHNPQWKEVDDGELNMGVEHTCAYLVDPDVWTTYAAEDLRGYAMGASGLEMFDAVLNYIGGDFQGYNSLHAKANTGYFYYTANGLDVPTQNAGSFSINGTLDKYYGPEDTFGTAVASPRGSRRGKHMAS